MARRFTAPGKDTSPDREWPAPGEQFQKRMVGSIRYLVTEKVVPVVFSGVVPVVMSSVRRKRTLTQRMARLNIVDDVWWEIQIPDTRSGFGSTLSSSRRWRENRRC